MWLKDCLYFGQGYGMELQKWAGARRTLRQIIREFWLPMLGASTWTAFATWGSPADAKSVITAFGPAFFLCSWLTGQLFRIRKQAHVESGLASVEGRLVGLVDQLEAKAADIASFTTGGDSICYFAVSAAGGSAHLTVVHQGRYPLYNVAVRVVDLEKFDEGMARGDPAAGDVNWSIGELGQGQAASIGNVLHLGDGLSKDFNIFFSARNGFFSQLLRFRKVNGLWLVAYAMSAMQPNMQHHQRVDDGYPLGVDGVPEGLEKTWQASGAAPETQRK